MSNLFDLTQNYKQVYDLISEGEESEVYIDTLDSVDEAIEDKADGYAGVIRQLESDNDGLTKEIKRLQDRKKSNDNGISRLKENLQLMMQQTGKTKFKTNLNAFGIQKNPASLNILDEKKIPKKYFIEQEPKLNSQILKKEIKDGVEIEGAELVQTESLRIR